MVGGSFLGWVAPGSHSEPCPTVIMNELIFATRLGFLFNCNDKTDENVVQSPLDIETTLRQRGRGR